MSDVESSCIQKDSSDEERISLSLLDLPVEIILHICSFVDAATLVHGLGLACKQFYYILNDDSFWKMRINQVWPDTNYPPLPPSEDDELFWKLSCLSIERQAILWRREEAIEKLTLKDAHHATVDGLLLMHGGNICISGARDRALVFWNLQSEGYVSHMSIPVKNAHRGWIWDLTAVGETVYSCSWDTTVKAWALTNAGLTHLTTYDMIQSGALLCVCSCPDLTVFATGSYCKTVLVYDPRAGFSPVARYQPHQRAVIRLAMNSTHILSASEDKTLAIWDQRAGRLMNPITVSKDSYPTRICIRKNGIYVGDGSGAMHVLDEKKNFEPVKSYKTLHRKGITGLHYDSGCLITSSLDKTVKISSPTDPPQPLSSLSWDYEIASSAYSNDVLAVSGTDVIEIYRPNST